MAKGRSIGRRLFPLLAAALAALLIIAGIVPNPFPALWAWVTEERPLAPGLAWQERLGARPAEAAAAGDAIAVATGSNAEMRKRDTGALIRPQADDWSAEWVVVAGAGDEAMVISQPVGESGYQVRKPDTGRVIKEDSEAVAVWGYRDAWLDLLCDRRRACQLRAHQPGRDEPLWTTDLPGERSGMLGGNPELAGPRVVGSNRIEAGATGPEPIPRLLGFPVTRRGDDVVVVVDTRTGQIRQELVQADGERVIVGGDRVIRSVMNRYEGVCVSEVTGYDAVTGDPVWGPKSVHLWGTGDVGCEQRVRPLAGGSAMAAIAPNGQPLVLDAYDGRVLWTGEVGERVDALSPEVAVIRDKNGNTRYGVSLGGDGSREWERRADKEATLAVAQCGVIVSDREPSRVYVWDPGTGEDLISLSTSARVLACASDGVLIADGRSIGFARFDGATAPADSDRRDPPLDSK